MANLLWRLVAWVVTRPAVFSWLKRASADRPYNHITRKDGQGVYMYRYWLFNPYGKDAEGRTKPARWDWLPSIRLHRIMLPDADAHLHDHPWDARTIVLRGWYDEEKPEDRFNPGSDIAMYGGTMETGPEEYREVYTRAEGFTGRLLFGEYHRITDVPPLLGVWTLFFTWKYRGTWGFKVNGQKVPYRKYLGLE